MKIDGLIEMDPICFKQIIKTGNEFTRLRVQTH